MSLRPLVELRCDGPSCSSPTKGVYDGPTVGGRPNIPDTWYTLHTAQAEDSHFCSAACIAAWAAKATGQTLMTYRITQNNAEWQQLRAAAGRHNTHPS